MIINEEKYESKIDEQFIHVTGEDGFLHIKKKLNVDINLDCKYTF